MPFSPTVKEKGKKERERKKERKERKQMNRSF